jgi:hypothetical protein
MTIIGQSICNEHASTTENSTTQKRQQRSSSRATKYCLEMIIDVMIAVVTRVFSFVVTIINRQQPTTTKHDTRKETKKNFIKLTLPVHTCV